MEIKDVKKLLDQQTKSLQGYVEDRLTKQTSNIEERLTKQTKELKEDYNRQGRFLLDEFKHQASIVAEQYTDLRDGHKNLEKKVDAILEMTAHNTENIEFIKSSLKRKVDLEEFESLEKRVMLLERKFQAI